MASDVLDWHRTGALRALDSQERRGEPGLARATEASARDAAEGRRLAAANLPARPPSHDPANVGADRQLHVLLLLDLVLVRHVPAREGACDTGLPGGLEPRRDRWRRGLGARLRGQGGTARRGDDSGAGGPGDGAALFVLSSPDSAVSWSAAHGGLRGWAMGRRADLPVGALSNRSPWRRLWIHLPCGSGAGRAHALHGRRAPGRRMGTAPGNGRLHRLLAGNRGRDALERTRDAGAQLPGGRWFVASRRLRCPPAGL